MFGISAGEVAVKLVQTGGIGVLILMMGRLFRRAKGLAVYIWLFGGMLTLLGVLTTVGILDVNMARTAETGRWIWRGVVRLYSVVGAL